MQKSSGSVFARSTTIHGDPQALNELTRYVRTTILPVVHESEGSIGASLLCDRESGECIVTTAWSDEDAMHRSAASVVPLRQRAASIVGGEATVQEWEIVLVHRKHQTHNGACARLIWARAEPDRVDALIGIVRARTLPRVRELPGFVSISLMVDRPTGRAVASIGYDSPHSMTAAEETGIPLRQELGRATGIEITGNAAYDIAIAGLRAPATD